MAVQGVYGFLEGSNIGSELSLRTVVPVRLGNC